VQKAQARIETQCGNGQASFRFEDGIKIVEDGVGRIYSEAR
jgi:hypothetical protein